MLEPVHRYQSSNQDNSAFFLFQHATVSGDILDHSLDLDDVLLDLLAISWCVFFLDTPINLLSVTYAESNSVTWSVLSILLGKGSK
jgi:hypothetical protein